MVVTKEELERFHDFAILRISQTDSDLTWRQLFELWRMENPTLKEYDENVAAIQQSLDAMNTNRLRSFSEFDAEFRQRHGISDGI